jgi:hypothetical protein
MAWLGMRDLVHGPRPEQNYLNWLGSHKTDSRSTLRVLWSDSPGSWFPAHGPRQDGSGTPGQVSCSEMGSVLSSDEVAKSPCPLQASLI